MRIIRMCKYEPLTNKELAQRLERHPATVLHHVRTLVAQGFLVPEGERVGRRGAREVPYRSTGKSWRLDVPGKAMANTLLQTFLDEVSRVPADEVGIARLGISLSAAQKEEFWRRISEVLQDFAARPDDPDGERMSVFLALHPEAN